MIRRDPFKRATMLTCDDRRGCGSVEEYVQDADFAAVAGMAKRLGWKVELIYGEHYKCRCVACSWRARQGAAA